MTIGQNIQAARLAARLSQRQLAELCGISVRTIQGWEVGSHVPRADALFKVATALGIAVEKLLVTTAKPKKLMPRPAGRPQKKK